MTVQTTNNRINYPADGATTLFSFNFQAYDPSHVLVYFNGVQQVSGFTVTLNADQNATPGGTVTFSVAPPLTDPVTTITLQRLVPNTQPVDWTPYDEFPAEVLERSQDDDVFRAQQLQDAADRALTAGVATPPGVSYELPSPEANRGLYWNATADGFVNGPTVTEIEADKNAAAASATAAANSAAAASSSETGAANSAAAALASENKAQEWAEKTDGPVETDQYSAKYWAQISQGNTTPIGTEAFWSGDTPPAGWLFNDDGAAYSRTAYAELFAHYGVAYGAGDGSTTFNVPNSRGRAIRIVDGGAGVDPDAATRTDRGDGTTGDTWGTNQADEYKSHTHTAASQASPLYGQPAGGAPQGAGNTGASGGNETRMKNTYRRGIVRAYSVPVV